MKPALSIKAVRDGPVSTVTVRGDLDICAASELLIQAASAVGGRTERLVPDLAGLTFLDCAGARALAMAASFAPAGCPVIIRSLSPRAARVLDLLGLDLETSLEPGRDQEPPRGEPAGRPAQAAATPNRIDHWQPGA
jgi:anti-anti-sigma factor